MPEQDFSLLLWSYGLSTAAYGFFAIYLVKLGYARREGAKATAMLLAVVLCALWGALVLAFSVTRVAGFLVISTLVDILRYAGWYAFLLLLIRPAVSAGTALGLTAGAVIVIAGGLSLHGMALAGLVIDDSPRVFMLHALVMIVFAIVLLEQLLRNVLPDSRWSVKPLILGLGGAFLFDLYQFSDALLFKHVDADVFSARGLTHAAVIPLLVLSTTRAGKQFAKFKLSQKAAFHSTTLMLVGAYLLFMALVGYYVRFFGGEWGRAMQFAILFAGMLVLGAILLSASMRARVRVLVGKHFFRYRYDYREEWLRFTRSLSAQNSLQAMGEQVIRGLADMVESPAGSLWLPDSAKQRFAQVARWNMPAIDDEEDRNSALCVFLKESGWVINLEEFRSLASSYNRFEIPAWLSNTDNAWLVVPLVAGNDLIGFVILARARVTMEVDWEVNDLLKTAGMQAASFLAQVLAVEELLEARKFDAFNRMSAFVVHDLKNIVTQLSLMVKNAERHGDNPEFQEDMLMTVQNSVERMRQLMLQLREGATPAGAQRAIGLEDIVQRIQTAKRKQGREVEVTVVERVLARGHEDRIERVIGHVVQNALDATDPEGRVWVNLDRFDGRARVVVRDTGHGMSAEFIKERLFKPFQTTKQAGMGIGAYESFQYVRELGGDVQVESEVGVGTAITMLFPLLESAPPKLV